jgi:hypothetical protein
MKVHGPDWADYIERVVLPAVAVFGRVVKERLLPTFSTISDETSALRTARLREYRSGIDPDEPRVAELEAYIAAKVEDEVCDFHDGLVAMRFATLALYTVGLHHLFEQHLTEMVVAMVNPHHRGAVKPRAAQRVIGCLVDLRKLPSWALVDELRIVANVLKHGEGNSADQLRAIRTDLFVHPVNRGGDSAPFRDRVRIPVVADGLYIASADFER